VILGLNDQRGSGTDILHVKKIQSREDDVRKREDCLRDLRPTDPRGYEKGKQESKQERTLLRYSAVNICSKYSIKLKAGKLAQIG
jgi:hypothetical protein